MMMTSSFQPRPSRPEINLITTAGRGDAGSANIDATAGKIVNAVAGAAIDIKTNKQVAHIGNHPLTWFTTR